MKHYQILINPTDTSRYKKKYDSYLYNSAAHLQQQAGGKLTSFFLLQTKKNVLEAAFHLFVEGKQGQSPGQAPFGGIELNADLKLEVLQFFWQGIEEFLQKQSIQQIRIKLYANCYQAENAQVLQYLWLQNGFSIAEHNLNYHLNINNNPLVQRMHTSEKRRLRKCYAQGYTFDICPTPDFELVHRLVSQCRHRKGFPVSISSDALKNLYRQFSEHFILFTLKDQQRIIALATGISVTPEVLYYFLPADDEAYLSYSPMVRLLEGMYNYGQQHGYTILDLGISTEFSQPNHGLINFKKHMGAEASLKLTFERNRTMV